MIHSTYSRLHPASDSRLVGNCIRTGSYVRNGPLYKIWGGPEGGYVYFDREREPGWYSWNKEWFEKPTYTKIKTRQIVFRIDEDGCEFIAVAPDGWAYEQDEDEGIIIGDDEEMQRRDRNND